MEEPPRHHNAQKHRIAETKRVWRNESTTPDDIVRSIVFAFLALASFATAAHVCDHRPSKVFGAVKTGVTAGLGTAAAAAGTGLKVAGLYAFPHAAGAAMLGSTAAGSSAAGTVGIIAGSGGALGTAAGVVMSPFVIVPGAVAAVGIGTFEAACYLRRP